MYRRGRRWYERIWPKCTAAGRRVVAVDATPAYHVWYDTPAANPDPRPKPNPYPNPKPDVTRYDAPTNMRAFFGPGALRRLRLVWMVREPVGKFWSYFWDLKSYGGEWDRVSFAGFVAPKLLKARACLQKDASSPLWPPSLPPPFRDCAPHLDHGLYWPQLMRWLEVFEPA